MNGPKGIDVFALLGLPTPPEVANITDWKVALSESNPIYPNVSHHLEVIHTVRDKINAFSLIYFYCTKNHIDIYLKQHSFWLKFRMVFHKTLYIFTTYYRISSPIIAYISNGFALLYVV